MAPLDRLMQRIGHPTRSVSDFFHPYEITDDDKKQGKFLTTCGAATYTLFRNLAAPKKPSEVPIADLMKLAAAHYHPKPSLAVQHFRFDSQTGQAGESVAAYLAELKRLFEHCSFSDTLNMLWANPVMYRLAHWN